MQNSTATYSEQSIGVGRDDEAKIIASGSSHSYGYHRDLSLQFPDALDRTYEALKAEGFGVLTEIDLKEKFKDKLGIDFRNYAILGACNPAIAHQSLQVEIDIGLLLPCNVIVYDRDGGSAVAAIDAKSMLAVTGNPQLVESAETVNAALRRAIDAI